MLVGKYRNMVIPIADSNGNKFSLYSVTQRAYARSESAREELNQNPSDIYKKYKDYFLEIAAALYLKDEIENLKNDNKYCFTAEAAKCLEELLVDYERHQKARKTYSSKGMLKQILKNDQYNAFLPKDILEIFKDMNSANKFVVDAMECFYLLFVSNGCTEEEASKKLEKADRMYLYSKRKSCGDFMDIIQKYADRLMQCNEERHSMFGLTSREHAIWLEYSNREIRETMAKMLLVRMQMKDIRMKDLTEIINRQFSLVNEQDVEETREVEEKVLQVCNENEAVRNIKKEYLGITGQKLNVSQVVAFVIINRLEEDEDIKKLLLYEIAEVPADGGNVLSEAKVRRIQELLFELYDIVFVEVDKYVCSNIWANQDGRLKDNDLLHKAVEEVENEK